MVSVSIVIIAILLNHMESINSELEDILYKVLLSLALGLPLFATIKLYFERFKNKISRRYVVDIAVLGFLLVYYLFIPKEPDQVFMFRYLTLSASLYLVFTLVPYFLKRKNYSLYVMNLITRFFITCLYSLVLFLGIIATIFTVEQLFDLTISSKIYMDIFILVAGLFAVPYFLGNIPTYDEDMKIINYPKVLRTLFLYIILPLISIYTVILYAYFAKMILTWEWPRGLVGNLVLWYGIISTISLFFVRSLGDENKWAKHFSKYFPMVILIPLGIMFFAIAIRVNEYGITIPRYGVIISGLWILGNMVYGIFSKHYKSIIVVISATVILLISAYGPLSGISVSIWSQNNRFESLLEEYGMLNGDEIIKPSQKLSEEEEKAISEILRYFEYNHELKDIRVLPQDFDLEQMKDVFGFEYVNYIRDMEYINYYFSERASLFDISEYDYVADLERGIDSRSGDMHVLYSEVSKEFEILLKDEKVYEVNMEDLAGQYHLMRQGKQPEKIEDIMIMDGNEKVSITFMFYNLNGENIKGTDTMTLGYLESRIYIKIK